MSISDKLLLIPQIRKWCDKIEKEALSLLHDGKKVIGHKLVRGRSIRKWSRDELVVEEYLKDVGLNPSQIFKRKMISIAQAEKLGVKIDGRLITIPEGKLTIAKQSDKREEVILDFDGFADSFFSITKIRGCCGNVHRNRITCRIG